MVRRIPYRRILEVDPEKHDQAPVVAWVVCDGLPAYIATDKLRPCTSAELLAYQYTQDQGNQKPLIIDTPEQQSFIDEREFVGQKGTANDTLKKGV